MASSGSFTTGSSYGRSLRFSWSIEKQSISGNYTDISWSLKGAGSTSPSWVMCGNFKVVISGSTVYSSSGRRKVYVGTTIASGTKRLYHDSQGSRSFSASAQAGIYYSAVNCSGSNSWSLTSIPRAAKVTSVSDFTDLDDYIDIHYSNPAGSAVDKLEVGLWRDDSEQWLVWYSPVSKTGSHYKLDLTSEVKNELYKITSTQTSMTTRIYIRTTIGESQFFDYNTATCTIKNAQPSLTKCSYRDSNSKSVSVTGNDKKIVTLQSNLVFDVAAEALKGATIKNIKVVFDDETKTINNSSGSFDFGKTGKTSDAKAKIVATDSRGYTVSKNLKVDIVPWEAPRGEIKAARKENYYDETRVQTNGSIASVENKNKLKVTYWTRIVGGSWSAAHEISNNADFVINLDKQHEWELWVDFSDKFATTTVKRTISKGVPVLYIDRSKNSIGVNCFPQSHESFEVNGFDLSNMIHICSSCIYSKAEASSAKTANILGAYSNSLLRGITYGLKLPNGYEYAYRLTAQVTTTGENMASIGLNNIWSNEDGTWSTKDTFRVFVSTPIFKESDIRLEDTYNYPHKKGMNLKINNTEGEGDNSAGFYNITLHVYLVKIKE